MPIYEYKCLGCAAHIEKMQKLSDVPPTICEKCGGRLEKQFSRTGFQFKGTGWYVTDYANRGKSETKSETKTETPNNSEKNSSSESTAKTETASKTTKSDTSTSKKE